MSKKEVDLLVEEFGDIPTSDPNIENTPTWFETPRHFKIARAEWHLRKGKGEPIINYMNSLVGTNDSAEGWMITNASNYIPSLNKAFEEDLKKEKSGINHFAFLKHPLLQYRGGVQCITNELPK
jgi:hypothetical protein